MYRKRFLLSVTDLFFSWLFHDIITSQTSKTLKMPRALENIEAQYCSGGNRLHGCVIDNLYKQIKIEGV